MLTEQSHVDDDRTAEFPLGVVGIPMFNEHETLPLVVSRLRTAVPRASVLVVDDGSPDGTGAVADTLAGTDPFGHVMHRSVKRRYRCRLHHRTPMSLGPRLSGPGGGGRR